MILFSDEFDVYGNTFLLMLILNFEIFKSHLFLKSFLQHAWTLVHADVGYMRYIVEN
jgi:hypothetical protein